MSEKPFARVKKNEFRTPDHWDVIVGLGDSTPVKSCDQLFRAQALERHINRALEDYLEAAHARAVEAARTEERLMCADFVRHVHGENTIADEIEKREKIVEALKQAKAGEGEDK